MRIMHKALKPRLKCEVYSSDISTKMAFETKRHILSKFEGVAFINIKFLCMARGLCIAFQIPALAIHNSVNCEEACVEFKDSSNITTSHMVNIARVLRHLLILSFSGLTLLIE